MQELLALLSQRLGLRDGAGAGAGTGVGSEPGHHSWSEALTLVRTMQVCVASVTRLLDSFLTAEKLDSGFFNMELTAMDVRVFIDSVVLQLTPNAAANSLTLSADMDEDVPPLVLADCHRLHQAIINFAGNACKFAGSRVALRVHRVEDAVAPGAVAGMERSGPFTRRRLFMASTPASTRQPGSGSSLFWEGMWRSGE